GTPEEGGISRGVDTLQDEKGRLGGARDVQEEGGAARPCSNRPEGGQRGPRTDRAHGTPGDAGAAGRGLTRGGRRRTGGRPGHRIRKLWGLGGDCRKSQSRRP